MLLSIPLRNKPLCMLAYGGCIFIGDSGGNIFKIQHPFHVPSLVNKADSPVSNIVFIDGSICYSTWNGEIHLDGKMIKLSENIIKSMISYRDTIIASVDKKLYVLNSNLRVINSVDTARKVYAMSMSEDRVICAMGGGFIGEYRSNEFKCAKAVHEGNVLSMSGRISGCVDGLVVRDSHEILYKMQGWIRAIWDMSLFASGKDVILDGKPLYAHSDNITGVVRVEDAIITCGLDFCYKIYTETADLSDEIDPFE